MNNKKTLVLFLVFALAFTVFMTACDNQQENSADVSLNTESVADKNESVADGAENSVSGKITYTVTVVDSTDNSPIEGIIIQFCDDENCKLPLVTDSNGTVSAEYDESNYHVTITEANGYSYEAEYNFAEGETSLTIALTPAE